MENTLSITQTVSLFNSLFQDYCSNIQFQGEISQLTVASSGHIYLSLKDEKSVISCVIWRSTAIRLNFKPEIGQELVCRGNPNVYGPSGRFQVIVNQAKLAGAGNLQEQFLKLKKKLEQVGFFDQDRKRTLPFLPKCIGVITSKTGDVIHDMSVKFQERYPAVKLQLFNAKVQGDEASAEIIRGLEYFNANNQVDLIIMARGGGSLEDLWCFNSEDLVKAIFASRIPVVTGIGHEPDVTLADLVADLRAPTPTAAAEAVVPKVRELSSQLEKYSEKLNDFDRWFMAYAQTLDDLAFDFDNSVRVYLKKQQDRVSAYIKLISLLKPKDLLQKLSREVGHYKLRLNQSVLQKLTSAQQVTEKFDINLQQSVRASMLAKYNNLQYLQGKLQSINPQSVMERGFSIVRSQNQILKDADLLKKDQEIDIQFAKGETRAKILKVKSKCQS